MVVAIAASRRRVRRGWRARYPGDFPTLGWLALDWTYAFLPSPADEKQPLVYTDEQARRLLEWLRLDPLTGAFVYGRRLHLQEAKGYGKSPWGGSVGLLNFRGPVCFDGWDADGQPVGVPWGTGERPAPWIQVAAVSEAQTRNTYAAIYAMLAANGHRAARDLRIDDGRTRLYLPDVPDAILESVTASAGSREGQRVTDAILDEPQLWFPADGGHKLADTILGNLTKMNGRAIFTGNAYEVGRDSVAERFDVDESGVLRYSRRPAVEPRRDWTREQLLASLRQVYEGAPWAPLERIVDDAVSSTADWPAMLRKFWNIPTPGSEQQWIAPAAWAACSGDLVMRADLPTYAAVRIAHDHRSAAVAIAQVQERKLALRVRTFPERPLREDELVPLAELERHLRGLHARFTARVLAPVQYQPRGRERLVPKAGPEVVHHGSFFEASKQRLEREGLVFVNVPDSHQRLAPAAKTLEAAALEGRLIHDGDPELAAEIATVVAVDATEGFTVQEAGPAARAAMHAVHRAMTAPRPPSRAMHLPRPR